MSASFSSRMTNFLLAGILIVLMLNLWVKTEHSANAETFMLDNCITNNPDDKPKQYLHVIVENTEAFGSQYRSLEYERR